MAGRAKGFTVSSTSVVVARRCDERIGLIFSVRTDAVMLKDDEPATATDGIPLAPVQTLELRGLAARRQWSAIRVTGDAVLGVVQEFVDNYGGNEPSNGVPLS